MTLGIVTFHHAPSYGAFFQAYALATYLRQAGHEVRIVDYMPVQRRKAFGARRAFCSRRGGLTRSNLGWLRELTKVGYYGSRRYVFSRAVASYLPLTEKRYLSLQDLQEEPPDLEACFFGSDQIWNCEKTGGRYDAAYFGDFGPKHMRRIAYAASFGAAQPAEDTVQLERLLGLVDRVSVREQSGVDIVRKHSGKEACRVLDPTFLIRPSCYPAVAYQGNLRPYVLGYFIGDSTEPRRVLHHVGEVLHLPVVDLTHSGQFLGGMIYRGPLHMLHRLKNAAYVVTNSFHGLALALIHQIDFTSVGLAGPNSRLNVRMLDLLSGLNLLDRFVSPAEGPASPVVNCARVDWPTVNGALEKMRRHSAQFIADSLTGLC